MTILGQSLDQSVLDDLDAAVGHREDSFYGLYFHVALESSVLSLFAFDGARQPVVLVQIENVVVLCRWMSLLRLWLRQVAVRVPACLFRLLL